MCTGLELRFSSALRGAMHFRRTFRYPWDVVSFIEARKRLGKPSVMSTAVYGMFVSSLASTLNGGRKVFLRMTAISSTLIFELTFNENFPNSIHDECQSPHKKTSRFMSLLLFLEFGVTKIHVAFFLQVCGESTRLRTAFMFVADHPKNNLKICSR